MKKYKIKSDSINLTVLFIESGFLKNALNFKEFNALINARWNLKIRNRTFLSLELNKEII